MKTRHSSALRASLSIAGFLAMFPLVSATPAFAEDEAPASAPASEEAAADNAGAPPAAPAPAPVATSTSTAQPAAPAAPQADNPAVIAVGIERLKPSAFPGQTRGIQGGSLALTFHGLQWPYMPSPGSGSRFILGISGWVWDDISYAQYKPSDTNTNKNDLKQKKAINQGRYVLRATPTWSLGDWFLQGQGEFVATTNQGIDRGGYGGADTDDLWLRVGMWNLGDIQVGRFEGWEVFHLGMGLDLNTYERRGALDNAYPVEFYGLTDLQYRSQTAGNVALHLYPMDILRFELLGQVGNTDSQNSVGGRAVGILDLGWFKLKAGAEYRKLTDMKTINNGHGVSKGFGGSALFIPTSWLEGGINFAQGYVDTYDSDPKGAKHNLKGSYDRQSVGFFLNVRPIDDFVLGCGNIYTNKKDLYKEAGNVNPNSYDEFAHLQSFFAIQYAIFSQFYVKLVTSYAKTDTSIPKRYDSSSDTPRDKQDTFTKFDYQSYSVRVRFSYFY